MKSRVKSALVAAACLVAFSSGSASAQNVDAGQALGRYITAAATQNIAARTNRVQVEQRGDNNGAAIAQNGRGDAARILQRGSDLTAILRQNGNNNSAGLVQVGRNNTATITQNGSDNAACVIQVGRNVNTDVVQSGGERTAILVTPAGTRELYNPGIIRRCAGVGGIASLARGFAHR